LTVQLRKGRQARNRRIGKIAALEEQGRPPKMWQTLEALKAKLEGALLEEAPLALRAADYRKYCRNGHFL